MYAVIRAGGRQFKVSPGQVLKVPFNKGAKGEVVEFDEVLHVGGDTPKIGVPTIAGAKVVGKVINQGRDRKVIAFKFFRRKGYKHKRGHRQDFTQILIQEIKGA